jgi:hypothetical protein
MLVVISLWRMLKFVGLAIGMASYAVFEGVSFVDGEAIRRHW